MTEEKQSQAVEFIRIVYNHVIRAKPAMPWRDINPALASALYLAIDAQMKFDVNDFAYFGSKMRGQFWIGADHERFFSRAVRENNLSACKAYEAWQKRKPFINRDGKRMVIGEQFFWRPLQLRLKVTSFREDGVSLIACSYQYANEENKEAVLKRRVTLTLDDIKADREHAMNEKFIKDFCEQEPSPSLEVRERILEGLPTCSSSFNPEQCKIAADRIREFIKELDTPDPSINLSDRQQEILLCALGLEKPYSKRRMAHRNWYICHGTKPDSGCQSLIDIGCMIAPESRSTCYVTDKGVRALGATRFIDPNVKIQKVPL